MSHLGETSFSYIMRKSGRKPTVCNCSKCQSQCRTPCLGTPEDIIKIIEAGYGDRLAPTAWAAGMIMGVIDRPVNMIQAIQREDGYCTFFDNGKCELHDLGLKPTEGKLSHHSLRLDNFNPKRSLSWLIAKEWRDIPAKDVVRIMRSLEGRKEIEQFVSAIDAVMVREKMLTEEIAVPKINLP